MFKASENKKSHPVRRKLALLSVIGLGIASIPIALAAPAQANVTNYACSVTPLKPIFAGFNSSGVKLVDYRIQVRCYSDRYINITQERWEEDAGISPSTLAAEITALVCAAEMAERRRQVAILE